MVFLLGRKGIILVLLNFASILLNFASPAAVRGVRTFEEKNRSLELQIITPISMSAKLLGGLPFVGPAFESALTDVRREYPWLNVSQEYVIANDSWADGECVEWESDNQIAQYYYHRKTRPSNGPTPWVIFILPGCSSSIYGIQQFGNGLNKVVLTSGVSSRYLGDKTRFPTLLNSVYTQTSPSFYSTFLKLAQFYNWTTVGIVSEIGGISSAYETVGRLVYDLLSGAQPRIATTFIPVSLTGSSVSSASVTALLERLKAQTRIYFLFADSLPANKFLVYVLTSTLTQPFDGSHLRNTSDEYHFEEARQSYSSCLLLDYGLDRKFGLSQGMTESHPFAEAWKAKSKKDYNYTYPVNRRLTVHAPAAYASVLVVSQVADQLRRQEPLFDFNDGALLARQFFRKTFETKVGNITFDHMGQRLTGISIGYYSPMEDRFVPFLSYERFSEDSEIKILRQPQWLGKVWPVPSEPMCGFQGLSCPLGSINSVAEMGGGLCLLTLAILLILLRVCLRTTSPTGAMYWMLDEKCIFVSRSVSIFLVTVIVRQCNLPLFAKVSIAPLSLPSHRYNLRQLFIGRVFCFYSRSPFFQNVVRLSVLHSATFRQLHAPPPLPKAFRLSVTMTISWSSRPSPFLVSISSKLAVRLPSVSPSVCRPSFPPSQPLSHSSVVHPPSHSVNPSIRPSSVPSGGPMQLFPFRVPLYLFNLANGCGNGPSRTCRREKYGSLVGLVGRHHHRLTEMMTMKGLLLWVVVICAVELVGICRANFTEVGHHRSFGSLQFQPNTHHRVLLPPGTPSRALNADPFYQKWPNPQRIPVEIDSSYTLQESATISDALRQIETDTKNCVRFVQYNAADKTDFLSVTPLEDAGSLRFGCWSFPGRVSNQQSRGQYIGVTRGDRGCVRNQREIMKVFMHALGFRMVQNRPDRDRYIKINPDNLAPEWRTINPYRKYLESQVFYRNLPFDFYSITFHSPQKFAKNALSPVYEALDPAAVIGTDPVLSRWDCVGIATMYGCNPNQCEDPYGVDEIPGRPTTTYTTPTEPFASEETTAETFKTLPPRPTIPWIPLPTTRDPAEQLAIATKICKPSFRVDSAVFSENGKIYLFSGQYFWTMDFQGEVLQAGIPIASSFGGRVQPPVYSAWSNGKTTTLVDESRQEITVLNEKFVTATASQNPKIGALNDAFSFNLTSGAVTYFITNNKTQIQIGPRGEATNFSSFLLVGLGFQIDAAFTIPILGSQIVGMFARNDFAYVTPCTLDIDRDPKPCFQSLPVGVWPLPFSGLVSYPAGGCRRRIRLRFPKFRQLK
ncbi:hypothetical protein BV898_16936 [Hypsibius exemplaris]|uniref:Peptidase M12A domain-containing protein n=1 Tax=Hypsibius exemplaris TaxID=2072580 RepID=A0A9X6NFS8_HYPEX|nr:hypothetical protein BV898_16936 [Hypsibius exemplaris]